MATGLDAAQRRGRPSEVALLLGLTRIGALIVVAGALLVFDAGLWLAAEVDHFGKTGSSRRSGCSSSRSSSELLEGSGPSAPACWRRGSRTTATG